MSEKPKRGVPQEAWDKMDVAGPSALARFTGIRQQYASLLMNRGKVPSVEEVLRMVAAFPGLTLADFVPNGHAVEASIKSGHPIPMTEQNTGPPLRPTRGQGGRGETTEEDETPTQRTPSRHSAVSPAKPAQRTDAASAPTTLRAPGAGET